MERMERMTDKCAVFIACLVCLLTGDALAGEAGGAALLSAPGVAMVLLAISAAALEHALPRTAAGGRADRLWRRRACRPAGPVLHAPRAL